MKMSMIRLFGSVQKNIFSIFLILDGFPFTYWALKNV